MCCSGPSPLDTLDTTFGLLASGPPPLALEGRTIGLRGESIGLLDLRAMMFHPATTVRVQRAVLKELVGRARRYRGQWVSGLPVSCCQAFGGRGSAVYRIARPAPTSALRCSPACSVSWMLPGCRVRR
jgi:hypothetical protein